MKIHGYRVEPGEIESVLKAHPAVNNAAVLLHKGAQAVWRTGSRSGRTAGKALTRNASCLSGTR